MTAGGGGRAVLGAAVMAVALGAGTGVGSAVVAYAGLQGAAARMLPALVCSVVAVPLVILLRRRLDRRPLSGIGLTGPSASARAFLLGVVVVLGSACVVLGAGTAAGLLRWNALDVATLASFVLLKGITAFLLEALPEELTVRGYAWTALRERHRAPIATAGATVLFLLVPGAASVVHAGVTAVLGGAPSPIGIAPAGEEPVTYLFLLVVFGLTLIAARTATPGRSVWTCIGAHLAFLTVNRVSVAGQGRETGWSAELMSIDSLLLVPAYLVLAATVFVVLARRARRRRVRNPFAVDVRRAHAPGVDDVRAGLGRRATR